MRNVTLAIEEEVLSKARVRAVKEGTSVNEVIRKYLREYGSHEDRIREAMDRILESAAKYSARRKGGKRKRKWRREDAYEERAFRGK